MEERQPDDPRFARIRLRKDLIGAGWSDRAIARMVATEQWIKVRRGAYVDTSDWRATDNAGRHEIRARAVLAQSQTDCVLSHCTAVPFYDAPVWGLDLSSVHLTRIDGRAGRKEAGVRQHCGRVVDGDSTVRHGVPVMSPTRVALEVTTVSATEPALVVMNHLLHAGLTTVERLQERYAREIERWSGTLNTDIVLRLANPVLSSVAESRMAYLLFTHHLPAPQPQYPIRDEDGVILYHVDFAWPELGVFLEVDGKEKYSKHLRPGESAADAVFREKRREDRIRELTGWRCIRISWADLERPELTAMRIRRMLFPTTSYIS